MCFLIKMWGRTTSYDKRFRRYENSTKNVKMASIIHENNIITSGNLKEMWMSHKLHLIRRTSMVKVAKKLLCWKFARQIFLSLPLFLNNQAARFISRGIRSSYFSRNLLQSFLLLKDFRIRVKLRRGGTFLCLASSVNVQKKIFF